ncbi:Flp pilus assembly protein, ATPase CpaF (modular protein) [Candidatus Desulfosporosinus infrequens]|uniref:Flp pilus assembly protein, ATPase CpaF (Modular protein) n=1 Tax=Candidatus Desulfosporosinus infrequens TaxID=2043169 RepID=A0A2U3K890_9FIRM|nr:Flp pilus assembly protein, ATPase CpaF (modular protein) [Candidatus Desulfosporosinus infrequens]
MKNIVGKSLYSRVSSGAKCRILTVSPMLDMQKNERIYFCEINEWDKVYYQALSETKVWDYYSEQNDQDLKSLYDNIEHTVPMNVDRVALQEIRSTRAAVGLLKIIQDGHDGVITTCHAATPHQELTDFVLDKLKEVDSIGNKPKIIRQTRREWLAEGRRRFGDDMNDWKFKCPQCGRINLVGEFEKYYMSGSSAFNHCIGYFLHPEGGCNWKTNGISSPNGQMKVMVRENGREFEVFEFADIKVE